MIIAGIDYSLTSPAICVLNGDKWKWENLTFHFLTDKPTRAKTYMDVIHGERLSDWSADEERYCSIADWAREVVCGCEEVSLEGYSYGSKGKVFNIAENTGVLKYKLWKDGLSQSIYPPQQVKKFATSKGNATKDKMYESFVTDTKKQLMYSIMPKAEKVGNPVSDIVDSYYICKKLFYEIVERKIG